MKKSMFFVLIFSVLLTLTACGGSKAEAVVEEKLTQVQQAIESLDLENAYELCLEGLSLELSEEQRKEFEDYKELILTSCYSGTFVAKVDSLTDITPIEIGKNSYFTVRMLKEYDEVFCRYTFAKDSEKDLVAQQYQEYLDTKYQFVDVNVDAKYTTYQYADENGNGLKLQIFDENYSSNDIVIILDADLFDLNRIDVSNNSAELFDPSILVLE